MTSPFDALDALASSAAMEGFGEEAVIIPRRGSQYAEAVADADRMAVKVRGIFSSLAAASDLRGQSRGGEFTGTTRVVSEQTAFWIAVHHLPLLCVKPLAGGVDRLDIVLRANEGAGLRGARHAGSEAKTPALLHDREELTVMGVDAGLQVGADRVG
jgi:hypothetical protein